MPPVSSIGKRQNPTAFLSHSVIDKSKKQNPTAFLSHSAIDKSFVEAVALRLGRVQVVFDQWTFETGDEFIKAIYQELVSAGTRTRCNLV